MYNEVYKYGYKTDSIGRSIVFLNKYFPTKPIERPSSKWPSCVCTYKNVPHKMPLGNYTDLTKSSWDNLGPLSKGG